MIVKGKSSAVDGATICGETFFPTDWDSAHAVFERDGRSCGISYATRPGRSRPCLTWG